MTKIFIVLDEDVERRLRFGIVLRGGKRGDLSSTIQEATEDWLKKHSKETKRMTKRFVTGRSS